MARGPLSGSRHPWVGAKELFPEQRLWEGGFHCWRLQGQGAGRAAHFCPTGPTRSPPPQERLPEDRVTDTPKRQAPYQAGICATWKRSQRTSGGGSQLLPPGCSAPGQAALGTARAVRGVAVLGMLPGGRRARPGSAESPGSPRPKTPGWKPFGGRVARRPRPSAAPDPRWRPRRRPLARPVWPRWARISKPRCLAANGPAPARRFPQPLPPRPSAPLPPPRVPLAAPT